MSKLVTLSLKLVERLKEMDLVPAEAEDDVEDVEENLEESLEDFCSTVEQFLASDFGDLSEQENIEIIGDCVTNLYVKIRRLGDKIEYLGDLVGHSMSLVLKD